MARFTPHTEEDVREMLDVIGVETLDDQSITVRLQVADRHLRPGGTQQTNQTKKN